VTQRFPICTTKGKGSEVTESDYRKMCPVKCCGKLPVKHWVHLSCGIGATGRCGTFFNGSRVNICVSQSLHGKVAGVYRVFRCAFTGTAQTDDDSAAAWERDLKLDVLGHIVGRLKLAM